MITVDSYTREELVAAFAAVENWLNKGLTRREIAERCFRGDSKFLDGRQELLAKCYGEQVAGIESRPPLRAACAPPDFERLLIVENQNSSFTSRKQAAARLPALRQFQRCVDQEVLAPD